MTSRPFALGLTGSIGMGKSTTARFFEEIGVPVWDADAAVHRIYAGGGGGAAALADIAPEAILDGAVDRARLKAAIATDLGLLSTVEARVHPLVAADRVAFTEMNADASLLVYDIPLLFETSADRWLDAVLVVTAPPEVQRSRVLARHGMTADTFERLLARQTPDSEKRARADFVIETQWGEAAARADVRSLVDRIRERRRHA